MSLTTLANAVPNVRKEDFRQGYYLEISTPNNSQLKLSCYLTGEEVKYHSLSVQHKNKTIKNTATKSPISFYINPNLNFLSD